AAAAGETFPRARRAPAPPRRPSPPRPRAPPPHARRRSPPPRPARRAGPAPPKPPPRRSTGGRALVEARLHTGVTHQVRVHLALLGCPVLGDALYGGADAGLPPGRHALHAFSVALAGAPRLESDLPPDLAVLLPP